MRSSSTDLFASDLDESKEMSEALEQPLFSFDVSSKDHLTDDALAALLSMGAYSEPSFLPARPVHEMREASKPEHSHDDKGLRAPLPPMPLAHPASAAKPKKQTQKSSRRKAKQVEDPEWDPKNDLETGYSSEEDERKSKKGKRFSTASIASSLITRNKKKQHNPNEDIISIGEYTKAERKQKIERFLEKRERWREANHIPKTRTILYKVRKDFADVRPRVGGRFVKLSDEERAEVRAKLGKGR